jgi:RNA polymerase sigma-70 factor (ECF subfamily)
MNSHHPMPTGRQELLPTRWTLIQRLKRWDDQEGWREFFDTYWKLIYSAALKSGLTAVEAQEVVQETVISVSRNIGDLQPTPEAGSFKSWLLQLTRWRIIDQVRKRRSFAGPGQPSADTTGTSTTARIPDPAGLELEKVWDEEWQTNLIQAALERVERQTSAKHYQIFYLHVIREVPVDKVAAATGVKPNDVYLVKHRLMPLFEKAVRAVESNQP